MELNKTGCQKSVLLFVCNECVDKCLQRADCTSCSSGMVINYVGFVFTGLTSGVTEFDIWHTVVCASTTGWLGGFPVTISSPRLLYNDIRSEVPAPAKHSAQYGFGDMCANNDGKHNIFDQFAKFVFFVTQQLAQKHYGHCHFTHNREFVEVMLPAVGYKMEKRFRKPTDLQHIENMSLLHAIERTGVGNCDARARAIPHWIQ